MLKAWDEMTKLEQYEASYSDFYKEAYGFRPRHVDTGTWTEADYEREFDQLAKVCNENAAREAEQEAEAVAKFERHVTNTICMGARERETALRWIMDASTADGDWDYFCYLNGLPHGYFRKVA
jgi:hypothetical protein